MEKAQKNIAFANNATALWETGPESLMQNLFVCFLHYYGHFCLVDIAIIIIILFIRCLQRQIFELLTCT